MLLLGLSVVTKDLLPFSLNVGVPSKQIDGYEFGERIPLPLIGKGRWKCPKTKNVYLLSKSKLEKIKHE